MEVEAGDEAAPLKRKEEIMPGGKHAAPKFHAYALHNYARIPQIEKLSREQRFAIEVVGRVLPFNTNNYVVNELIDWDRVPDDPIFVLNFPQADMLLPHHFQEMARVIQKGASREEILQTANAIRMQLNPHPAGQLEYNIPELDGQKLYGLQHKYRQTVLFFPNQGQTCHAYCSFCFRWPQFVGIDELKFAMRETEYLVEYIRRHPEITDVLFTGGDPLIMRAGVLARHLEPLIDNDLPHLQNIRIGSKALSYWPYKFVTDSDADELLRLFEKIVKAGKHLAIMAHFSHPRELETPIVHKAVERIRNTGAEIRTQSPILRNINARADVWAEMWKLQVTLGMIPYYMFIVRDTGAQHYFSVPLVEAWQIFRQAYQQVSGLARTVRGPSMSTTPGKIQVLGVSVIQGEKVIVLRFLQGRNPDWVHRPFFARYDEKAVWIDDLEPAFGESEFFFEPEPAPSQQQSSQKVFSLSNKN